MTNPVPGGYKVARSLGRSQRDIRNVARGDAWRNGRAYKKEVKAGGTPSADDLAVRHHDIVEGFEKGRAMLKGEQQTLTKPQRLVSNVYQYPARYATGTTAVAGTGVGVNQRVKKNAVGPFGVEITDDEIEKGIGRKVAAAGLAGTMALGGGAGAVKGGQAVLRSTANQQQSARHIAYDAANAKRVATGKPKQFFSFKNIEDFNSGSVPKRFDVAKRDNPFGVSKREAPKRAPKLAIASSTPGGGTVATNSIMGQGYEGNRRSRARASVRAGAGRVSGQFAGLGNGPLMQEAKTGKVAGGLAREHGGVERAGVTGARAGSAAIGGTPNNTVDLKAPAIGAGRPTGVATTREAAPAGAESRASNSTKGPFALGGRTGTDVARHEPRTITGHVVEGDEAVAARTGKKAKLAALGQSFRDNTFGFRDNSRIHSVATQPVVRDAIGGPKPRGNANAAPASSGPFSMGAPKALPAGQAQETAAKAPSAAKATVKAASKGGGGKFSTATKVGIGVGTGAAALGGAGAATFHLKTKPRRASEG